MYNEEELLNESYDKCTVSKYILEAKSLILSGIKLEEIHKNDNLKVKSQKKDYTPINSYKPSGNLVYDDDLLNKIKNKFI